VTLNVYPTRRSGLSGYDGLAAAQAASKEPFSIRRNLMTASPLRLQTERLALVPFTSEVSDALPMRDSAQELVGAAIPDGWPDEELAGLLSLYAGWVRADASVVGYGPWIVIARGEGVVVGSGGFIGEPTTARSSSVLASTPTSVIRATRQRRRVPSSTGGSTSRL
jgi:hypothetical protein